MYEISAGENTFNVNFVKGNLLIDGQPFEGDISKIGPRHFHIIHNHKSYNLELIAINREEKTCTIRVNSAVIELTVRDKMDLLLDKLGMNSLENSVQNSIKAPMPGLILDIMVNEGESVQKGDPVIILEAMKMENVIKATGEATVTSIQAEIGMSVEKNQVLIKF